MEKLDKLYEGKAKKLYATDDTNVLWVEYMNQATAGNGLKKAQIEGKGSLNNRITSLLFHLLEARGVKSHFLGRISNTEQLVKRMRMFPLEIIMRNTAAGSFAKRYGVKEGTPLKKPLLEFCVKSDELADPFINPEGVIALGLATEQELAEITRQAHAVNNACLLYTSDAADEEDSVDLGGRRIIKKKKKKKFFFFFFLFFFFFFFFKQKTAYEM